MNGQDAAAPDLFEPTVLDDDAATGIRYVPAEGEADPVQRWLAACVPGGGFEAAAAGLADGSLEPALSDAVVLGALRGLGHATVFANRPWDGVGAVLTTPDPRVFLGIRTRSGLAHRFAVGVPHDRPDVVPTREDILSAIDATLGALRAAAVLPAFAPAPDLRPFRAREGMRAFAQLAARKDIEVDPEAAAAVDALQARASDESRALMAGMRDGTLTPEDVQHRIVLGTDGWLRQAHALVGKEVVAATLDDDAVPRDRPAEVSGMPPWTWGALAAGRDGGRGRWSLDLMEALQFFCRHGRHDAIDRGYGLLDVGRLSPLAMNTLLRGPFVDRGKIQGWEDFRERVRAELGARGIDGDRMLVGLGGGGTPAAVEPAGQGVSP